MADAPRSILAWLGGPHQGLSFAGGPSGKEIEYIRADVARANAELAVAEVQRLRTERDRFETALGRACQVGGTTYLVERAEKAEAERDALRADLRHVIDERDATFALMLARAEKAEAERERLLYVLDGVAGAIDTGRNEPLQVWRDQINIARQALKGQTDE